MIISQTGASMLFGGIPIRFEEIIAAESPGASAPPAIGPLELCPRSRKRQPESETASWNRFSPPGLRSRATVGSGRLVIAMPTILVMGTLDTKGVESGFLAEQVRASGCDALVVDLGILGTPAFEPDLTRDAVAEAAGERIEALAGDRGRAVEAMTRGIEKIVPDLYARGRIDAVVGLGGSAGTAMATAAMRALPLGVPKVMVSTIAGGDVTAFVGQKDITMIPSIVDISGLNRISRQVMVQAAAAVSAMAQSEIPEASDKPVIAASMFGNTTQCVEAARSRFEASGFEVLVFHATGAGGQTMEGLVTGGFIAAILDVTTTELAGRTRRGGDERGPGTPDSRRPCGDPCGGGTRLSGHGQLLGAGIDSGKVLRAPFLPPQPERDANANDAGGEPGTGTASGREAQPIPRAGCGLPAAQGNLRDLRAGPALSLARGGRGPVPVHQGNPSTGDPGLRAGSQHQRSGVRRSGCGRTAAASRLSGPSWTGLRMLNRH